MSAQYCCLEPKCDLKPVCEGHTTSHVRWGHPVSVLVGDGCVPGAPSPNSLLGVTHCPKADHGGPQGLLTHVCNTCTSRPLLCRRCIDDHMDAGHSVCTAQAAAVGALAVLQAALPSLRQGLVHHAAQASAGRRLLETLAQNHRDALQALAATTARLHADVESKRAAAAAQLDAAFAARTAVLRTGVTTARACAAELATMVATVEVAMGQAGPRGAVMQVHVSRSAVVTQDVTQCRALVQPGLAALEFRAAPSASTPLMSEAWVMTAAPQAPPVRVGRFSQG